MRPAVFCTSVIVAAVMTAAMAAQKPSDDDRAAEGTLISVRGCVSGSLLKSVVSDPGTGIGSVDTSDRYRMVASKALKAQIKKANKAYVEVTGRVKPGPQAVVKGTKMGGTSVGIGVAPGYESMDQRNQYTPTIEVEEIVVITSSC